MFCIMSTDLKLLREIYEKNGSYARELSRNLKLGMPSIKNSINKNKNILKNKKNGRNIIYEINYSKREVIPYIYLVEYSRLNDFPKKIQYLIFDFIKSLRTKPLISLIFGSYARNEFTKDSDVDILLVGVDKKEAEEKAKMFSLKYDVVLSPVYLGYDTFKKDFYNQKKKFFQDLKRNKIIINGVEWWVELKNEEA